MRQRYPLVPLTPLLYMTSIRIAGDERGADVNLSADGVRYYCCAELLRGIRCG